ncbi:SAM-dependent methyltransferase [Modestobacter sp. VKM Ac-2978]|uniref:SAM-dependent methyltransferase n=1 Tax=Modestobacter sp. VKM Ac-2978 TaxID=3004132 RepID=UPI0022AAC45D|nr:class I SAM-dependent methyltransferase [Modestobacter sp. VKM Ac-2978]MCZ2850489.1 class I SAM-dependent methyltransferase [Modestobacter sp. VKM Ac-2978]
MDRAQIFDIAHLRHPIAAPVGPEQLRHLVGWLSAPTGGRAVDLGCGEGEWLQELLMQPGLTGVGIDHMLPASAVDRAAQRGLGDRVRWAEADAATWSDGRFDVVLCVGASHAFGRLPDMLAAVRKHLRPGGQALVGDTIWEDSPSASALAALEASSEDFPDLAGFVRATREHGFEPSYGHTSTLAEWDDYEFSWTGSLVDWALREAPTTEDRDQALAAARAHRDAWLGGWRRQLGFATLVLHDVATAPS